MEFSLEAKIRKETAKEARALWLLPAVVYGKDVPSTSINVNLSEFIKLYRQTGQNHIITLSVDKKKYPVLVHEAQRHPVKGDFLHLDFYVVNLKEKTHVEIPVKLIGVSKAVAEGGELHQTLNMIEVKCFPTDIVDSFELDISPLEHTGKVLHVSNLTIDSKKFEILSALDAAIVSVHAHKEHKTAETTQETATQETTPAE